MIIFIIHNNNDDYGDNDHIIHNAGMLIVNYRGKKIEAPLYPNELTAKPL